MKSALPPTPKGLSLPQIMERFSPDSTELETDPDRKAREYLESIRWPYGPVCPHCENRDRTKIWKLEANLSKKIRPGLYHCAECDKQFTVMVGTIFTDSHIPLRKWLVAWYLICNSKKGISAMQIQRALGLGSYRTAWMMMHKIRHTMADPAFTQLEGEIEADEMYYGPNPKKDKRTGKVKDRGFRKNSSKVPIAVLVDRKDGHVRSKVITDVTPEKLRDFIADNITRNTVLNTDSSLVYPAVGRWTKKHRTVNHRKGEYARRDKDGGNAHVNNAESYFSLLRRGLNGSFHYVSKKHLFRYCDEFNFRWNHRNITDGERMESGLRMIEGKRMTYK